MAAVPFTTALLYAAVRGGDTPAERHARRLRLLLLEEEVYGGERCVECRARVDPDWVRCPFCTARLRSRCDGCGGLLKLHWSACPECAVELERLAEPEHVAVQVAHPDLEHAPGPLDRRVEDVRTAAA